MNNEVESKTDNAVADIDDTEADETEETIVLSEPQITDNVGDVSVEINVEELIANIESENDEDAARKKEIRRRLEEVAEEKSFEDTYAIDLGDDD
jgi:hypothetical protein